MEEFAFRRFGSACLFIIALGDGSSSVKWQATLYWGAVMREWAHPIRSNFVFTPFLTSLTLVGAVPRSISGGEPFLLVVVLVLTSNSVRPRNRNLVFLVDPTAHFWDMFHFEVTKNNTGTRLFK